MKRAGIKYAVVLITACMATIGGIYAHDKILEKSTMNCAAKSFASLVKQHDELFYKLIKEVDQTLDHFIQKDILFCKKGLSSKMHDMIKATNIYLQLGYYGGDSTSLRIIREHLHYLSVGTYSLDNSYDNLIAKLVTLYNSEMPLSIDVLQEAVMKYPEEPILYDLLCRYYYDKGDYDSVFKYGVEASKCDVDNSYMKDVVFLLYMSSCKADRLNDAISYIGFAKEEMDFSILDYNMSSVLVY